MSENRVDKERLSFQKLSSSTKASATTELTFAQMVAKVKVPGGWMNVLEPDDRGSTKQYQMFA